MFEWTWTKHTYLLKCTHINIFDFVKCIAFAFVWNKFKKYGSHISSLIQSVWELWFREKVKRAIVIFDLKNYDGSAQRGVASS